MKSRVLAAVLCATGAAGVAYFSDPRLDAQTYTSGQNISPAFEGWEKNDDGTFNLLFGYMNRNWEEEIDVPIGAENSFAPGEADQGQPTHFQPRRNRFVFRVEVPKDFGEKELVWTLTTKGKTEKAYATLRTDSFVDDVVIASETGSLGAGSSSPEIRANKRPTVTVDGAKTLTARVGQPLSISATVKDDGVPRRRAGGGGGRGAGAGAAALAPATAAPADGAAGAGARGGGRGTEGSTVPPAARAAFNPPSRVTVGKVNGLHLSWFVYRGAGKVTFDPVQIKVWEDTRTGANSPWAPLWQPPVMPPDGKLAVNVTFAEPGTYVLRARADDGALYGDEDVTVTVTR
jgi:hypothetical protein